MRQVKQHLSFRLSVSVRIYCVRFRCSTNRTNLFYYDLFYFHSDWSLHTHNIVWGLR